MKSIRFVTYTFSVIVFFTFPLWQDLLTCENVTARQGLLLDEKLDDSPAGLVLKAPEVIEIGELARLDLRDSTVDGISWSVLPETPDFEVIENGRRAYFSSRVPGSYLFVIAGAKGGEAYLVHHTVVVDGPVDPNRPVPFSSKVRSWVKSVPEYANRESHKKAIGGVFRKMATDDIAVEKMLDATAVANSAILGDDLEKWVGFLDSLGTELDTMVSSGSMKTKEDYAKVWGEIADALEG